MKKLLYIQYCYASGNNPEYNQRVYDRLNKTKSELFNKNDIEIQDIFI